MFFVEFFVSLFLGIYCFALVQASFPKEKRLASLFYTPPELERDIKRLRDELTSLHMTRSNSLRAFEISGGNQFLTRTRVVPKKFSFMYHASRDLQTHSIEVVRNTATQQAGYLLAKMLMEKKDIIKTVEQSDGVYFYGYFLDWED